jgi:hypothetical protein
MVRAKKLTAVTSIPLVTFLLLVITMSAEPLGHFYLSVYAENDGDSYSNGYDRGYEDGQEQPVNEQIRSGESGHNEDYVNGYLDGFLDGCLSVEGNNQDICNSAIDA